MSRKAASVNYELTGIENHLQGELEGSLAEECQLVV